MHLTEMFALAVRSAIFAMFPDPLSQVWIFAILRELTDKGKDIAQAQQIFYGFYLLNLARAAPLATACVPASPDATCGC